MTEKERMLAGMLYKAQGEELAADYRKARKLIRMFNGTTEDQLEYRRELLGKLFKSVGNNPFIEPPFHCDYGCHISIGQDFYANFDCIILDVCEVKIGHHVFFGPRVCIYTPGHPIDAEVRNTMLEYGSPVTIGDSVWIGGSAVVNPGVSIGNNVVIGSGSVVNRDIPDDVVAAGNPCRVIRQINDEDKAYWAKMKQEYFAEP